MCKILFRQIRAGNKRPKLFTTRTLFTLCILCHKSYPLDVVITIPFIAEIS